MPLGFFYRNLVEIGRYDTTEASLVRLLLGYVVAPALGGFVYEDERLIVHSNEADAVRAVYTILLQNLNIPASQVRADCLVRLFVNAFSHISLSSSVEAAPLTFLMVWMSFAEKRRYKR